MKTRLIRVVAAAALTGGRLAGAQGEPGAMALLPEAPRWATPAGAPPEGLGRLAGRVSPARMRADVDALAGFGTRHTLSDTTSSVRGIGAAREWIKASLERALASRPDARVFFDVHPMQPDGRRVDVACDVVNVCAVIPGTTAEARERLVYATAHYDTINGDVMDRQSDAPGANDNASGTAALLEIARALGDERLDATVVLMATAGEEQGLLGARLHAAKARAEGRNIVAVLNMDIVGDHAGTHARDSEAARAARRVVRVFSEGAPKAAMAVEIANIAMLGAENDSPARQLARCVGEVGAWAGLPVGALPVHRNDRFLRGGDHSGFLEAGYPASIRFTAPFEDYARQHQNVRTERGADGGERVIGDLPAFVDEGYLADVTRLVLASLVNVANAPAPPGEARLLTAKLETGTTMRWDDAPDADRAGYEVLVRSTTAPAWERVIDVGPAREWRTELSKDNWLFAVRSYDRRGYRSVAAFPQASKE